jgi:tetratricopeptide (TPR) repeat protein
VLDLIIVTALLGFAIVSAVLAVVLWRRSRRQARQGRQPDVWDLTPEALTRLRQRIRILATRIPSRRSLTYSDFPAIEGAAAIEAWLLQSKPRNALAAATIAVRSSPQDWRVRLHLARTLLYCEELEAAAKELVKARLLGDHSAAQDYLEARIRLHFAEALCSREETDPKSAAARLRHESAEALDLLLDVAERDPAFSDAAFHASLLALRLGFEEEARLLLEQLRPHMEVSPERETYLDTLSRLN